MVRHGRRTAAASGAGAGGKGGLLDIHGSFLMCVPAGLRATQFSILAKLKRLGPLTINTLARDMVMDRTTLGRNILPLERDGLIRIEATPSDRRAKELHLTKAGEKRLQAAHERWSEAQARFEGTFGPRRAAELRKVLRAVVASEFGPADDDRAEFADR